MTKERLIYMMAFVMDGCFGLVGLSVPLLAVSLGAQYDELGIIGATGASVYAVCCLATGSVLKRWSHRKTAAASAAGIVFCFAAYTLVASVWHIVLVSAAVGLVLSAFWPTMQSWVAKGNSGERLIRILGKFNISWGAGVMAGPALGGQLFAMDPHLPFTLCSIVVVGVFLTLAFSRPGTADRDEQPESQNIPTDRRFLTVSWIANFATFFATGLVRSLFPKFATDAGVSPGLLGQMMAIVGLAQVVSFYLVSRSGWWQNRLGPMIIIQCLGAGGLILIACSDSILLLSLSLASVGLLIGATFTWSMFYSLRSPSRSRSRAGIHEAIVGSGFLFGPLLGGLCAEHVSPIAPYLLGAVVICLVAVVEVIFILSSDAETPVTAVQD